MAVDDLQTALYRALSYSNDDNLVQDLCSKAADGPLHQCNIHDSSVLHLACYCRKFDLANKLFDNLPEHLLCKLPDRKNAWGNTVLHDASTSNRGIELLRKMLQAQPDLLLAKNNWGETAVFQATRYGKKKVVQFLAEEVDKFCNSHTDFVHSQFFHRTDNTTILHMAILTRNFDMALMIARKYPYLCDVRAQNRTALQLLACSPEAFKSGARFGLLTKLIYSSVSVDEQGNEEQGNKKNGMIKKVLTSIIRISKSCWILPLVEEIQMMKRSHKDALLLLKILSQSDTSWMYTHEPHAEVTPIIMLGIPISVEEGTPRNSPKEGMKNGTPAESSYNHQIEIAEAVYRIGISESDEAPLLLAARKGCIEIVEEILKVFPQAVNYLNHKQENLLHVAIKNRNMEIFKLVEDHELPLRELLGAVDNKNNSILHMVGCPKEVLPGTKVKSPVLQLSDDLQLLERLQSLCPRYLINHRNNEMMTADELFAKNNETLRNEAKDWLKRTAEHSTGVIILIATVAFAAAYTVPGGPDQQTGYPLLLGLPFFLVFTVTDVLSLGFALTAVVVFLSILTSPFQLKDFRRTLPQKLLLGFTFLFLSVTMMMVAFASTIILMVNHKARWTKIALYVVAFFPICIFMLSYIPLYIQLAETLKYWIKKIGKSLPRLGCGSRLASHSPFKYV